jgi:hypothetical protein
MRFRVWEPRIKAEKGDVLLRLFEVNKKKPCICGKCDNDDPVVSLRVVDEAGETWDGNLISFKHDVITLQPGVDEDIGLPLDEERKLKFDTPIKIEAKEETKDTSEKEDEIPEEFKKLLSMLIAPILIEKILKKSRH